MIGRHFKLENWRKATQNLTRYGVRIIAIFALAFVLSGAFPSSSAQADLTWNDYDFVMNAVPSTNPICTGQSVIIKVSLSRQLKPEFGITPPQSVTEADVAALSNNNVGTITPTTSFIGHPLVNAYQLFKGGHPSAFDPDTVMFRFTANDKPGVADIRFRFIISSIFGRITVDKIFQWGVDNCAYKVLMILQAPLPSLGLLTMTPDEIKLEKTSSGHYSGATDLKLRYSDNNVFGCPISLTTTPSQVEYKAHLDNEMLYLDFTIQEFTETVTAKCDDPEQGNPPPIIYTIPTSTATVKVPSEGGVTTYSTPLGLYWIIVTLVSP